MLSEEDKRWILERLEAVELRFSERLEATELRFSERLEATELRFSERLEKVETTLLTEFHKWASPLEMRQRSHAMAIRALDDEMEAISDRL